MVPNPHPDTVPAAGLKLQTATSRFPTLYSGWSCFLTGGFHSYDGKIPLSVFLHT